MKLVKYLLVVISTNLLLAVCPSGFYEDDCGNCWLPYCYDYVSHELSYDSSENECSGSTETWVLPGDPGDPFFNNYCDSCPEGFTADQCGHCWQPYCYTLFTDPPHTVFWDLSEEDCVNSGYGYYPPGESDGDPYFGYNCEGCPEGEIEDDCGVCQTGEDSPYWNMTCGDCNGDPNGYAMVDDCGDCQLAYCYNYVTHETNFETPCDGDNEILVMPDNPSNPYWNSGCDPDGCPDDLVEDCAGVCGGYAMVDDCGECSDNYYCYDYVTHQTNTDFPCDGPTEMMVMPDSEYNSDWNASCTDCAGEVNGYAMVDDCGECQSAYCYDYVTHQTNTDFPCDGPTEMMVMPDDPSNPYWNSGCDENCLVSGDVNSDGTLDVMDVVAIVSHILGDEIEFDLDCSDIVADGNLDVMDVVAIVNIILGGRSTSDATEARLDISNGVASLDANGFVGAVQMTLSHGAGFSIELTDRAMVAEYRTDDNSTRLIIVAPESDNLFTAGGDFTVEDIIVANVSGEATITMPSELILSKAYPNPFNPSTSMNVYVPADGMVNLAVYNVMGQKVATLYSGNMAAGSHSVTWNASQMTSGLYFVRAESSMGISIQRISLIK